MKIGYEKIFLEKKEFRKKMKDIRNSIEFEDRKIKSNIVFKKLIEKDFFKKSKTIMSFMSFSSEIDTEEINKFILNSGKKLLLPRVIDKITIEAINYSGEFSLSKLGIKEPLGDIFNEKIDLILVPGLAFDKNNFRMGYGGGYYDRFIEKNKNSITCALCFKEQLVDEVPKDKYDKKMNFVISDKKI